MSVYQSQTIFVLVLHLVATTPFQFTQRLEVPDVVSNGSRPFTVRLLRIICSGHPNEYLRILECRVKTARGNPTKATFIFALDKPIETLRVSFTLLYKYTSSYRPLLISTDFNGCEYLGKGLRVRDPAADFLYEAILSFTPWLKPCPWLKGNYSVKDFHPIESKMPSFLPAGEFRTDTRLSDAENKTILNFQYFFLVRAKGVFDLSMG